MCVREREKRMLGGDVVKAATVFVCAYERNAEVGMPMRCRLSDVQKVLLCFSSLFCGVFMTGAEWR